MDDVVCAICLQKRSVLTSTTPCGHTFCRRCLDVWRDASHNGDCPSCRSQLPEAFRFADACVMAEQGRDSEALEQFREVVELCVDAPWAAPHYNLGLLLSQRRDFLGAEREFRRAAELRRDDADAALNWGKALLCIGRRGEACAAFQRAKRLRPASHEEIQALLARAEASKQGPTAQMARRGLGALMPHQVRLLRLRRNLLPARASLLTEVFG